MESAGSQTYSSFLKENIKELALLLILGALAGAAYYFFSLRQSNEIDVIEKVGVLDLHNITINDYQMEHKKWKLEGEHAIISEKSDLMRIEKVKIWVFSGDNTSKNISAKLSEVKKSFEQDINLFITADQGLIERDDNRVTISGDVVLLYDDGSKIHTDTAIYDAKKDIITIPKPVRVLREGYTMLGSGLMFSVSEGQLNLNNPVMLKFSAEKKVGE